MYKDAIVSEKKQTRKRKTRKHNQQDGVYAAINPASYKIGHIVNINTGSINVFGLTSSGGLVFKYIDKDDHYTSSTQDKSIFLENYGYYFGDIPIDGETPFLVEPTTIRVEEVDFANLTSDHLMKMRQMSIVLTELTFRQIFALDRFIRENMNQKRFTSMHLTVELQ